ncbi:MAG: zinc ribbon domain-containing protein [Pseudodesulfovibrio sp.]
MRAAPSTEGASPFLSPFSPQGPSGESRLALGRMIEAWAYVLALTGAAAACAWYDVWWPLYPAVGVIGLAAWLRKV